MKEYHYTINYQNSQQHKVQAESDFEALQEINLKHNNPARVYPISGRWGIAIAADDSATPSKLD